MQSFGRYEIIEQLGAGAMGAVYKARDPMMGRDVAIKTILSHAIEGPQSAEFRERFFREAQAAGRLAHPGIVTMYDVAEQESTPFLVMEYVAGRTLQSVLESERLDMGRVYDFGVQIAEALDYAHRNGVIHRDIKPANILITQDGKVKIADFGVARLTDSQVTTTGQLLGTPSFMAPEQFTGMRIDGRADLFAAGVVVYWMATGDKPFTGDTILAVQYRVVHTDPLPPRKLNPYISRELEAAILRSVSKDPADRYQSGQEFASDLRAAQSGQPVSTKTVIIGPKDASATILSAPAATVLTATRQPGPQPGTINARPEAVVPPVSPSQPQRGNRRLVVLLLALFVLISVIAISQRRAIFQKPGVPAPVSDVASSSAQPPEQPPPSAEPNPAVAAAPVPSTKVEAPSNSQHAVAKRDITPDGIDNSRSVASTPSPPAAASDTPAPADTGAAARGGRNTIGSPLRQRELKQAANSVRLVIKSPAVPEFLTVIVRVDNEILFRRDATALPPEGLEEGKRRFQAAGPSIPLSEERLLPPGSHMLQVTVLRGRLRLGQAQEISADFNPKDRRTLLIEFGANAPRAGQRGAGRFSISLE
jgi:serine/threonine-protein kinase